MSEPIDFTVALPEAGPGAILCFAFSDLEKLQEQFGPDYIAELAKLMDATSLPAIRTCMEIATKAGNFEAALHALPISEIKTRVMDAFSLRLSGARLS